MAFGLRDARDLDMLREWAKEFRSQGFTPEELLAASRWLVSNDPPQYRDRHLYALVSRVRQERARLERRAPPPEDPMGTCVLCRGTGRVIVPSHPMPAGRWYTQAVTCKCLLGRWVADVQRDRSPLRLEDYERECPAWEEELSCHEAGQRRLGERACEAAYLDRLLGALRKRDSHAVAPSGLRARLESRQPHLPDEPL